MSYYPDLSPHQYHMQALDPSLVSIGWLDGIHPYSTGLVNDAFLERLWPYCRCFIREFRGVHTCELCSEPGFGVTIRRGDEELLLGSAEIRVPGQGGLVYAAPNFIYHYIVAHHYLPPQAFIDAVMDGLSPDSDEYQVLKKQWDWPPLF